MNTNTCLCMCTTHLSLHVYDKFVFNLPVLQQAKHSRLVRVAYCANQQKAPVDLHCLCMRVPYDILLT